MIAASTKFMYLLRMALARLELASVFSDYTGSILVGFSNSVFCDRAVVLQSCVSVPMQDGRGFLCKSARTQRPTRIRQRPSSDTRLLRSFRRCSGVVVGDNSPSTGILAFPWAWYGTRVSLRCPWSSNMPLYGDVVVAPWAISFSRDASQQTSWPGSTDFLLQGAVFGSNVRTVCLQMLPHQCTCGGCRDAAIYIDDGVSLVSRCVFLASAPLFIFPFLDVFHQYPFPTRCSSGVRIGGGFGKFEPSVASISFGVIVSGVYLSFNPPALCQRALRRRLWTLLGAVSPWQSSTRCPVSGSSLSEVSSEDELTLLRRLRRLSSESQYLGISLGERLCPSLLWTSRLPSLSRTLMRQSLLSWVSKFCKGLLRDLSARLIALLLQAASPWVKVLLAVFLDFGSVLCVGAPTDGANLPLGPWKPVLMSLWPLHYGPEYKYYSRVGFMTRGQTIRHQLLNTQMSANDKFGLGYGDHKYDGILSYENEVLQSVFMSKESELENQPLYDRFVIAGGMHVVPPPMTRNYMPSGPDIEIDYSQFNSYTARASVRAVGGKKETDVKPSADFNGGPVAFGGSKGYITGKGKPCKRFAFKDFQYDHPYVACQKGKQHKASCLVGVLLKILRMTCGILKDFIRQNDNQLNQKVKTIRCDNGTEFKNRDFIEFCGSKEIKREYSNAKSQPKWSCLRERIGPY
ncbi:retrovirus-related pol polyprotein from transposon TNT 1-94 [Tanacetum coccineum]|uniref:Retrovirus-related pol polyprotein from transposon TNT 1-94 n=1 Tax=Tanacetum coccineum TaxID=301880 RepID=A0ABQ5J5C7_9ASTR